MKRFFVVIGILVFAMLFHIAFKYEEVKKIKNEVKISNQTDFEYVKSLFIQSYYHPERIYELLIYKDKHTGHLYITHYGGYGISFSRYFE